MNKYVVCRATRTEYVEPVTPIPILRSVSGPFPTMRTKNIENIKSQKLQNYLIIYRESG